MPRISICVYFNISYICIYYSDVSFYYTKQSQIKFYSTNHRLSKVDLRRVYNIILNISSGDDKKDFGSD